MFRVPSSNMTAARGEESGDAEIPPVRDQSEERHEKDERVSHEVINPNDTMGSGRGRKTAAIDVKSRRIRSHDRNQEDGKHSGREQCGGLRLDAKDKEGSRARFHPRKRKSYQMTPLRRNNQVVPDGYGELPWIGYLVDAGVDEHAADDESRGESQIFHLSPLVLCSAPLEGGEVVADFSPLVGEEASGCFSPGSVSGPESTG